MDERLEDAAISGGPMRIRQPAAVYPRASSSVDFFLQKKPHEGRLTMPRSTSNRQRKLTPLSYMLGVINDPTAEPARRDRMAICAAQYVHPRMSDGVPKRDRQAADARKAGGSNTEWAGDLDGD